MKTSWSRFAGVLNGCYGLYCRYLVKVGPQSSMYTKQRFDKGQKESQMRYRRIKLAMFVVWVIVSAAILCTLIVPFMFSHDSVDDFVPECEWKVKYNKECPLCGMTSSFFYISEGRFRQARLENGLGIYLYLLFILNEIIIIFTSIKKGIRRKQALKETLSVIKQMLTRERKEMLHANT